MLPSIFIIRSEFLFLIEIVKTYYYIILLFHVLRNIFKLRLTHSAGLTIVLPSLVFLLLLYDCLRKV